VLHLLSIAAWMEDGNDRNDVGGTLLLSNMVVASVVGGLVSNILFDLTLN